MQRYSYVLTSLVAALSVAAVEPQRPADPDPLEPHGFVEPCTVGNYQEMNTECELCPSSHADLQACSRRFAPRGFQKKCHTLPEPSGNFNELWCGPAGSAGSAPHDAPTSAPLEPATAREPTPRSMPLLFGAAAVVVLGLLISLQQTRAKRH